MVFVIILVLKNRTLISNYDIRQIESVGKNQIKDKIEGQGQPSQKLIGSLTVLKCIFIKICKRLLE